jgi:uncharacterized protein YwqG
MKSFKTTAEIEASLREAGVGDADAARLAQRSKPYIQLTTSSAGSAGVALGATRIGGVPDLPVTIAWPWRVAYPDHEQRLVDVRAWAATLNADELSRMQSEMLDEMRKLMPAEQFEAFAADQVGFKGFDLDHLVAKALRTAEPAPLSFIAQIDLAAVWSAGPVDPDLPRLGRLLFFYDVEQQPAGYMPTDIHGVCLIHDLTPTAALRRTSQPIALAQEASFHEQQCSLHAGVSPPAHGSAEWRACMTDEEDDSAANWWSSMTGDEHDHRVGGYPIQIRTDMQTECALVSNGLDLGDASAWTSKTSEAFKADAENWLLLLQIASDKSANMMWGDVGNLYVWIRRDALRARRFAEARVILQSF